MREVLLRCLLLCALSRVRGALFAFTQGEYEVSLEENIRGKVYAVPAVSQQKMGLFLPEPGGGSVQFKIVQGDPDNYFEAVSMEIGNFVFLRIKTRGGLNMALNRELKNEYNLLVTATLKRDGAGNMETRAKVRATIADRNDMAPMFRTDYETEVSDDTPLLEEITRVAATDPDIGLNGDVFYRLAKPSEFFSVDPASGAVRVVKDLRKATELEQVLSVEAIDRASILLPSSNRFRRPANAAPVRITITKSQTKAPELHISPPATLNRTDRNAQSIALVRIGEELRVALEEEEGCEGYFQLAPGSLPSTFLLSTIPGAAFPSNREELCNISLTARDPTSGAETTKTLAVKLSPSDLPLSFRQSALAVEINETAPIGSLVAWAELAGPKPDIQFQLFCDPGPSPLAVDPDRGSVFVAKALDFESAAKYSCRIRATSPTESATLPLSVQILDENDNAPSFHAPPLGIPIKLDKDTPMGAVIAQVSAQDPDSGKNGKVTFKLVNPSVPFRIDPTTGDIHLAALLTEAEEKIWSLQIRASDWGSPLRQESQLNITVFVEGFPPKLANPIEKPLPNLNSPQFEEKSYFGSLPEDAPIGTWVTKVKATDPDPGFGGLVQYSLSGNEDAYFIVDIYSGDVTLFRPLNTTEIKEFRLQIVASDLGTPRRNSSAELVISVDDVNDHYPVFKRASLSVEVREDVEVGTKIVQLEASDEDKGENAAISYRLLTKTSDFSVDADGTLSVRNVLDREHRAEYALWVATVDGGRPPKSASALVSVRVLDVNDNPPKCLPKQQRVRISEDWPLGAIVTCVRATDPDEGSNAEIHFALDSSTALPFEIVPDTGCLFVRAALDFEARPLFNISVEVTDGGRPQYSSLCNLLVELVDVDENSHPPKLDNIALAFSVFENEEAGSVVGEVKASDPNDPPGPLEYRLENKAETVGLFAIDSQGVLTTKRRLDREQKPFYWLRVFVSDTAAVPKTSAVDIYVEVLDRNDHAPLPLHPMYFGEVAENSPPETVVLKIDATDEDEDGTNGLIYRIVTGDPQSFFQLNPTTGYITTFRRKLDRETLAEHELEVTISDQGDPPHSSLTKVIIRVTDVDDNPPAFAASIYNFNVPANTEKDIPLCRVFASDKDEGGNAKLHYSIPTKSHDFFSIEKETGEIFTSTALTPGSKYHLTVEARDGEGLSGQTEVHIQAIAEPKFSPTNRAPRITTPTPLEFTVSFSEAIGETVGVLEADDPDGDAVWFDIASGNTGKVFDLRRDTGAIQIAKNLAESKQTQFALKVSVSDGMSAVEGLVEITIRRTVVSRPAFNQSVYTVEVSEKAAAGTNILTLSLSEDAEEEGFDDAQSPSQPTFFLHGASQPSSLELFKIEPRTGLLRLVEQLDRELSDKHVLIVGVRRRHLSSLAQVVVNVKDDNDYAPAFLAPQFKGRALETAPIGAVALQVFAVDEDTGPNGEVSYSILSGNDHGFWSLDSLTGKLRVAQPLSLDIPDSFLVVKASDKGRPPLSDIANVHLVVGVAEDSVPRFTQDTYLVSVPESTLPSAFLLAVYAESFSPILYQFKEPRPAQFDISPVSGHIFLRKRLNFEANAELNFTVIATSKLGATGKSVVRVSVLDSNDHHPQFTQSEYVGTVEENMPPGSVVLNPAGAALILTATDKDHGGNAILSYEIIDQWATEFFAVDYGTGALRTRRPLDFELQKSFAFRVQASDMGSPALSSLVPALVHVDVLDLNDVKPEFKSGTFEGKLFVPTSKGARILSLQATDPDTVGSLRYTLKGQAGLAIEDGAITVSDPSVFNQKTADERLRADVTVSDGEHESSAKVEISVIPLDSGPTTGFRFQQPSYSASVPENKTFGNRGLLVVDTLGTKPGERVSFSLVNGNPLFMLNPETGELLLSGPDGLDREKMSEFQLVAEARLHGTNPTVIRTGITLRVEDVNDNAPKFLQQPYSVVITSDTKPGTNITDIKAIDLDEGNNALIEYRLEGNGANEWFRIHPSTGIVSLEQGFEGNFRSRDFQLQIIASDNGRPQLSSTAELNIKVVHKAVPVFEKTQYNLEIKEDAAVGTQLTRITAKSTVGGTVAYTIVGGDPNSAFDINYSTGTLRTAASLDREKRAGYNLTVRGWDVSRSDIYSDVQIRIQVLDINDNAPEFGNLTYSTVVSESSPIGSIVFKLSASDPDNDATLTFSLTGSDRFEIAAKTGEVTLRKRLDFETETQYELKATVEDGGIPPLSSTATLKISVRDVNDNPPMFADLPDFSVLGDVAPGHLIGVVSARDKDSVGEGTDGLMFSVLDGDVEPPFFQLHPNSGMLRTGRTLNDAKSDYTLNVSVSDGAFTAYAPLRIRVQPSPTASPAPYFLKDTFVASLAENQSPNTGLIKLNAAGGSGPLRFAFCGEASSHFFALDKETGEVTTLKSLDYERQREFRFPVAVSDAIGRRSFANLVVNVLDENDNPPLFLVDQYKAMIPANASIGSDVLQFYAEDRDLGDSLEYSMYKDPNHEQPDIWKFFKLNRKTGRLSLRSGLETQKGQEFRFMVRATDRGNPPFQREVPATVVVSEPKLHRLAFRHEDYSFMVKEDAGIGTLLPLGGAEKIALQRAFPDATFSIASAVNDLPFSMDGDSGMIKVIGRLDREERAEYAFHVQAKREVSGALLDVATASVRISIEDVNDNAPQFEGTYQNLAVSEDAPVGWSVSVISASDPDEGPAGEIRYSLAGEEAFGVFDIDAESGWLKLTAPLDRELKSEYRFTVQATDKGSQPRALSSSSKVVVKLQDVNDNPPEFLNENMEFSVSESAPEGAMIGLIRFADRDLPPNNTTSLVIVEGDGRGHFSLRNTGELFLAKPLDFEEEKEIRLRILASDGLHSVLASAKIIVENVNDNAPECEAQRIQIRVKEDIPIGSEILSVKATDLDSSQLFFHLTGRDAANFDISSKGELIVAKSLDRESADIYELSVQVEDEGGLFCRTEVKVHLLDVNDNAPQFQTETLVAHVAENIQSPAHIVTQLRASDPDEGPSGKVEFALASPSDTFWVDEISGVMTVLKPLDREAIGQYNLSVIVTDQGLEKQLSSEAVVTVIVDDVNDHPPEYTRKQWEVEVGEQEEAGTKLLTLEAFTKDLNDTISFHIVDPPLALNYYNLDRKTGVLTLTQPLDYELRHEDILTVEAVDSAEPPLSSTALVTVRIIDANDNNPEFSKRLYKETVPEDAVAGSRVLKLTATDKDSGENSRITFRLARENANYEFFNVSEDGWVTVTATLDHETLKTHRFLVEAWDSGSRPLTDTSRIQISVGDINDNPPVFAACNLTATVQEGLTPGVELLTVEVSDKDGEPNASPFVYGITGVGAEKFHIGSDGIVRTSRTLAFADGPHYSLTIHASDSGTPQLSSECPLSVRVIEESKFPPELAPMESSVMSYLGEFPGGQLCVARGSDRDEQDVLVYGLVPNPDLAKLSSLIRIERESGVVIAERGFPLGTYRLNVSVSDGKFTSFAPLVIETELIGEDELGFAISVRVNGVDAVSFVEEHQNKFRKGVAKLLGARPKSVKILSIQDFASRRFRRDGQGQELEVLFAVRKGKNAFFRPEYIRRSLEGKSGELSEKLGVPVAGLVTEVCRVESCFRGQCRDRLSMDDTEVLSIAGRTASFVAPKHRREAECICAEGYGGGRCDVAVNACSRSPCVSRWAFCIPQETPVGFSCACPPGTSPPDCSSCPDGACSEETIMSLSGKSYVRYTLSSPLIRRLQFALQIRTVAPDGVILEGAGKADYHRLEVKGGRLRYSFNCGSGEGVVEVKSVVVSDGSWHDVSVIRRGRHAILSLDQVVEERYAPGSNSILNLDSNDVFLGAVVRPHPSLEGHEELSQGFTGCLRRLFVDGFELPLSKTGTRLLNVAFGCPDSFIAGVCSSAPCLNGGKCVADGTSEYRCSCEQRFTGRNCETDLNPCSTQPCPNGATCQNLFNDYFCLCPAGFTERKCLSPNDYNPCASSPCANGGQCLRLGAGFACNCTEGWAGERCLAAPPNIDGNNWGITIPEIVGGAALLLVIVILTVLVVVCCRCQRRNGYKKARYLESHANNEIMLDHPHARNQLIAASELEAHRTPELPPPLPPRHRGFNPHRNSKLSNLESAQLTGLPTIQVRPLSFSDCRAESVEQERWEEGMATCAFGRRRGEAARSNLENARNYGSAAEELEELSRFSNDIHSKPGTGEEETDWKDHLDLLSIDSIERIKAEARAADEANRDSENGILTTRSLNSIQCLPEEAQGYDWDYSDWNSTMDRRRKSGGGSPLPPGVSQMEDTDSEFNPEDDCDIPALPTIPSLDEQLKMLEASPAKLQRDTVLSDMPPEDEYVTMRPLSSYQRHLDKYLPKHRPPPDSARSQRKPLLGRDDLSDSDSQELHYGFPPRKVLDNPHTYDTPPLSQRNRGRSLDYGRMEASVEGSISQAHSLLSGICDIEDSDSEEDRGRQQQTEV